MNKDQEKRAEEIINCLKKHNGKTTFEVLNGGEFINKTLVDTSTILQYLEDLKLVEDMGLKLFRLTIRGSKFESLEKTYKEDQLKIENLEANLKAAKRSYRLTILAIFIAMVSPFVTVLFTKYTEEGKNKLEENNGAYDTNYMNDITTSKDTVFSNFSIPDSTKNPRHFK